MNTTTIFAAMNAEATVPPAPPNTPPEATDEEAQSVVVPRAARRDSMNGDQEHLMTNYRQQAESSSMGADRVQRSGTPDVTAQANAMERLREAFRRGENPINDDDQGWISGECICLICLEPLTKEDFMNGIAISLECQCKGEAALRHKDCAQKWVDIKGDRICDVCRAPITNLVAPPPRSEAESNRISDAHTDESRNRYPSPSDVFDCIRMTWVVSIVCILFFHLNIASALVAGKLPYLDPLSHRHCGVFEGLLVAVMYTWVCQLVRCAQYQVNNLLVASDQEGSSAEQNPPPNHRVVQAPEIIIH